MIFIIFKGLSALDVLHESGLLNLFGKYSDLDQVYLDLTIEIKIIYI